MMLPKFRPIEYRNRSHRWGINIPGYLSPTGRPQRRFFLTKREASAFGDHCRRQYEDHQFDSTYLHRDQIAEAARAYKLIEDLEAITTKSHTLLSIVQDWVERQRLASQSVTLEALLDQYIAARRADGVSINYLRDLIAVKTRLMGLCMRVVSMITPDDIESAVRGMTPSVRNSHLRTLNAVLAWGMRRGLLQTNPVARVEPAKIKLKDVEIYTPDETERLLQDCLEHDLDLLPYRIVTIYCGIRPHGEAQRVEWSDINWEDGVIRLRAGQTKRGRARYPMMQRNAVEWLEEYRLRGGTTDGKVVPYSQSVLEGKIKANHRRSGVKSRKNASRHSFCSYFLAYYGDVNSLVLQSGHANPATMWRHYYQCASKEEAAAFWAIRPTPNDRLTIAA